MRARVAAAALLGLAGLAGCGAPIGDLMAVDVSGGFRGVREHIRVTDDGRASCNGGALQAIPSQTVLDAREAKRGLRPLAKRGAAFPAGRARDFRDYVFRSQDGTVTWSEGRPLPRAVGAATLVILRIERRLCR